MKKMKTALVTTTINVPHVLALYRRLDANVRFFIAADHKSPTHRYDAFVNEIGNATWCFAGSTEKWACSEAIGWNTIQRRNIATLEAIKWGADIIVSIDDDNIPIDAFYFHSFRSHLVEYVPQGHQMRKWSGLLVHPETSWFDVGALLDPPASHRGFPHQHAQRRPRLSHVVDAPIGVSAGIVLGDPDIAAMTRVVQAPHVLNASVLLDRGIAVAPVHTRTVFNSQNTAFVRELAPAFCMLSGVGRYDDIFASLIMQRVMCETGHYVHFGHPFVYQERNAHDLQKDIDAEMFGQRHILEFSEWLYSVDLGRAPVASMVKLLFSGMTRLSWMPAQTIEAGLAWCADVERAMA